MVAERAAGSRGGDFRVRGAAEARVGVVFPVPLVVGAQVVVVARVADGFGRVDAV